MIKKFKIKNFGFTILEVILYLAILSTLVFGIGLLVDLVSVARVKNQTITEVDQQALQIIHAVTQSIRNAKSVTTPTPGQNQGSLVLVDSNNNASSFVLNSGILNIDRGEGDVALNNNQVVVNNLVFKNLSRAMTPPVIQINFTISYINSINGQIYNYSKNYVASANLYK